MAGQAAPSGSEVNFRNNLVISRIGKIVGFLKLPNSWISSSSLSVVEKQALFFILAHNEWVTITEIMSNCLVRDSRTVLKIFQRFADLGILKRAGISSDIKTMHGLIACEKCGREVLYKSVSSLRAKIKKRFTIIPYWIIDSVFLSPLEKCVLYSLLSRTNLQWATVQMLLVDYLHVSSPTFQRAKKRLGELGLLTVGYRSKDRRTLVWFSVDVTEYTFNEAEKKATQNVSRETFKIQGGDYADHDSQQKNQA